ncbi:MFS transporter [Streptomyces sp. INA 01156]
MLAMMQSLSTVFVLAYATQEVGVERSTMLIISAVAVSLMMFTSPAAAHLSDRFGRRPVTLTASIGCG